MRYLEMDLLFLFLVLRVLRYVTHITSKVLIKMCRAVSRSGQVTRGNRSYKSELRFHKIEVRA